MKIKKQTKPYKFHLIPYCVAETIGSGAVKGKNFMWTWWLFCFEK